MKFVFTLLLISFSTIAFSQMTFKKLVKIYKMDMDQFEEYAINRGYKFHDFKKDEDYINRTAKTETVVEIEFDNIKIVRKFTLNKKQKKKTKGMEARK